MGWSSAFALLGGEELQILLFGHFYGEDDLRWGHRDDRIDLLLEVARGLEL